MTKSYFNVTTLNNSDCSCTYYLMLVPICYLMLTHLQPVAPWKLQLKLFRKIKNIWSKKGQKKVLMATTIELYKVKVPVIHCMPPTNSNSGACHVSESLLALNLVTHANKVRTSEKSASCYSVAHSICCDFCKWYAVLLSKLWFPSLLGQHFLTPFVWACLHSYLNGHELLQMLTFVPLLTLQPLTTSMYKWNTASRNWNEIDAFPKEVGKL